MDEFGVLTERFGLKPQGKSAPMAASKRPTNDSGLNLKASSFSSSRSSANSNSDYASFPDDLNGPFQSSSNNKTYSSGGLDDYDDIFSSRPVKPTEQQPQGSSSFNFDSMFSGLNAKPTSFSGYNNDDYDMLGGMPGDIFGSFASSAPKQSAQRAPTNDLLGDLGGVREKLQSLNSNGSNNNRSGKVGKNVADFDDLIPGFGGSTPSNNGTYAPENPPQQSGFRSTQSNFSSEDPFVVLESVSTSTSTAAYSSSDFLSELEQISKASNSGGAKSNNSTTSKVPPKPEQVLNGERSSGVSSIDELEDFAWGRVQNNATGHTNFRSREERVETSATRRSGSSEDDLDFFNMGFRSNSAPRSRVRNLDPVFEAQTSNREGPRPSRTSSATSIFDDFSSVFGASAVFEEFEEVEGESEERRKARQGRHQRAQDRALQAVADMNKRDLQAQQEQEERRRIAETWDNKIKGWSGGKEGNMRALLSTLQCVLWPECGWEPVSLTDLITSSSVKKVFRKAALCFHPDKVQQKGATLEQKYIAEKVFDILKETWNKFNKEELS